MRITKPSAEFIELRTLPRAILMETCGRLCYKSEEKITADSAPPFIRTTIKKGHGSVTEFAVFTYLIECPHGVIEDFLKTEQRYLISNSVARPAAFHNDGSLLITGTARAFREAFLKEPYNVILRGLIKAIRVTHPIFVEDLAEIYVEGDADFEKAASIYLFDIEAVDALQDELKARHRFALVRWKVSRAVSHELVRHRPVSWLQESQRYCRYSDDKFGNEVTFIEPSGAFPGLDPKDVRRNTLKEQLGDPTRREIWRESLRHAEEAYLALLKTESPQCARLVLPNSCKTELVQFCTLEEWQIFFGLRWPKTAEPSMREVTHMVYPEFNQRWPDLFPERTED